MPSHHSCSAGAGASHLALATAAAGLLCASFAGAQTMPVALVVNDTRLNERSTFDPDDPIGPQITVTSLASTSIVTNNAGGWAFHIRGNRDGFDNTGNYYAYIGAAGFGQPTRVLRVEGVTAGSFTQATLGSFFDYTDAGDFAYGANDEATNHQGLFFNDELLLRRHDPVADGKFFAGGLFTLSGSPSAQVMFLAELADTNTATVGARTLVRRNTDGSFTRLLYPGQDGGEIGLPGETVFNTNFSIQGTRSTANRVGGWMSEVRIGSDTATDNTWILGSASGAAPLMMNGGGLVRQGSPIPEAAGGLPGETWNVWSFHDAALNDRGDWLLGGRTSSATSIDDVMVLNGQIVMREGDSITGTVQGTTFSGTLQGFPDAAVLNNDGDWATVWTVNIPDQINRTTLIVNGEIVFSTQALVDLDGAEFPGTVNQDLLTVIYDDIALSARRPDGTFDLFFTGRTNGSNAIQYADTILFQMTIPEPGSLAVVVPLGLLALRRRRSL